jgi:hypothetical protein
MNSKLKRLADLEKLVPHPVCGHPDVVVQYDDPKSKQEVERIRAERENCATCRQNGKMLVIVLNFHRPKSAETEQTSGERRGRTGKFI